jgi:hypothetical protein
MAAKRGRRRGRKAPKRRTSKAKHIGPVAHLAHKVEGLDGRLLNLEAEVSGLPKRFVKRKRKHHKPGPLEGGHETEYWASGE